MEKTGLLVLTNPSKIGRIVPAVKEHVLKTLYVQLSPQRHLIPPWVLNGEPTLKPPHFRTLVGRIYSLASCLSANLDIRVLLACLKDPCRNYVTTNKKIDIVIFDKHFSSDEVNKFIQNCLPNKTSSYQIVTIDDNSEDDVDNDKSLSNNVRELTDVVQPSNANSKMYDNVVLGGTFDRLHAGHKILLSEALLHCSKKLTVGVTDTVMLKTKKLWELIEPCEKRISDVHDFLNDVDNTLEYDIVPISDPFGPTKDDPNLQLIVVSSETVRGGQKVNELRKEKGLPLLETLTIELLETMYKENELEEDKVSSSNYRMKLLGSRLREPEPRSNVPNSPYVIGLTGSIASGKSSVAKRLEDLGAGVVDCDMLAHGLYKKGEQCYKDIVSAFGERILDTSGEVDRKVLGSIVFCDKKQLVCLNSIMWPAILKRAKEETQRLQTEGRAIVVLDAAVLVQAGWHLHCHETWVCIIPPDEAVLRLQRRNGLLEEAARTRITALPSNEVLVAHANVVFCTLWAPEVTQLQVEKAWAGLQEMLQRTSDRI